MSESISLSSSSLAYAQTPRLAVADQDDKPVPSTPDDLLAKSQAEFAAGERRMKVAELQGIASKKKALEALHLLQQRVAEAEARKLANPPVPAKVLEGMEAARALTLAKKIAQESGVHFPPAHPGDSFVFSDDKYTYTAYGDGRITRSDKDVYTPEQWAMVNKSHQDRTARLASGAFEAQVAEIDQRISALQQELGPIGAEEWGPEREGPNIAPILSMLA